MPRHAPTLTTGRASDERGVRTKTVGRVRESSAARGYTWTWRKASRLYLQQHPLCMCPACGGGTLRIRPATVVDHIVPHRGDAVLFWDEANWQAMAKRCHDHKTAVEDGGFGRPRTHAGVGVPAPPSESNPHKARG